MTCTRPSRGAAALAAAALLTVSSTDVHAQPDAELEALRSQVDRLERQNSQVQQRLDQALRALGDVQSELVEQRRSETRGSSTTPPVGQGGAPRATFLDLSLVTLGSTGIASEREDEVRRLQFGGHDPKKRGFTLQQAEVSLVGAVDSYLTGEAHVVYFLDPEGESQFEVEEAFLTTQALPYGLQLEAGHFFTEFGRINPLHPHAWHWQDQPVILSRLFGGDGMRAPGVRVGWLTPLPWFSELHVGAQNANGETMRSFLASEDLFDEDPVAGRSFVDQDVRDPGDLVYLVRWLNSWDPCDDVAVALGASALFGPNATGPDGYTRVWGADFVAKWRPAGQRRGWPFVVFESEWMQRAYHADDDAALALPSATLDDFGGYAQALWGFMPRWAAGLRYEYAGGRGASVGGTSEDFLRDDRTRISPLLAFYPSEFSRLRLQWNFDHADHLSSSAQALWLGFEFGIGAHGAHRF
jgi:hypothetical protein